MIAAVRGIVEERGPDWIRLSVGGVTLHVSVPTLALETVANLGEEARLHTYLYVREDTLALYGFPTSDERDVFVLLLGVSGIGPRAALALLSTLAPGDLAHAVEREDSRTLQQAPGIGARAAERLIVDLRGKLLEFSVPMPAAAGPGGAGNEDVLDALIALGYSTNEARQTIASLGDVEDLPLEERLRRALQALSRG